MKRLLAPTLCLALWTSTAFGANGTTTLTESVTAAVQYHPEVKALIHNREAMYRNLYAACGRFLPTVDLYSAFGFQNYNNVTTRSDGRDDDFDYASDSTITLTQNIFDGMDRINTSEAAKDRLSSAENRLLNNVETIGLDAVQSHIDVSRQRILVDLAEKNVEQLKEVLSSISERVEAGAGNRADEMQARGRVARAETTLVTYLGDLRTAEATYRRVTGGFPEHLATPQYQISERPASMQNVIDNTLYGNPLIRVFQAELDATKKDTKVNESEYYPNLDLELSSRYAEDIDSDVSYLNDNRAMLVVNWNLFRGGTDYQTVKASEARSNQASAELANTTDDLTLQSATAWNEYQTALGQIAKYSDALEYSRESLDMYLIQFNVGERSLLDVLDAINEVFNNAVLLETAEHNETFSLYKFRALEGNLLHTLNLNSQTYADNTYR